MIKIPALLTGLHRVTKRIVIAVIGPKIFHFGLQPELLEEMKCHSKDFVRVC